jgi:tRNA(adenine34) deaminase
MRYIFENGNSNKVQKKETNNSKYNRWMNSILRRSEVISKVELPISSIILDERGRCIGRGVNRRTMNNDPLGHAEIMALRQASLIKNDWRFNECIIITNLEPCTMCASALIQARMGKVVFGAYDQKRGGLGGSIDLSKHKSSHHKMQIVGGVLEEECSQMLKLWFKKLRTQK